MKRRYIYVVLAMFFLLECGIAFYFSSTIKEEPIDITAINDLRHQVEKQTNGQAILSKFDFSILDKEDDCIFQSSDQVSTTLVQALQGEDIILPLANDTTLIIQNNKRQQIAHQQAKIFQAFLILLILQLIMGIVYTERMHHIVFRPFRKLRVFAQAVAGGNLDLPLDMDKQQAFGAFSESFDLMREELKYAKEQEMVANQSKKELVAKLSHDIKTPIASIKAVSEVMLIKNKNEREQEQLEIILAKADQINALVSDLFHATLEELEHLTIHYQEVSSQSISSMIAQSDYQKWVEMKRMDTALLVFDPLRLSQVIDNLIYNAYKYASAPIMIEGICHEEYFEVVIQDHGNGIDVLELAHLQDKYFRGTNALGQSGSGLGLYIATYFMKEMHGDLCLEQNKAGLLIRLKLSYAK